MVKLITLGWLTTVFLLFVYSFTQIDLGLTLTRVSWWQPIQKSFQQIGYFNRPLSTGLYLAILFLLFTFYFLLLRSVVQGKFSSKQIWGLILATAGILWFSYNAFSYDLFNYIMDARMITFYGKNPYQYRALDFPGDPMLGFMHWTHRYYPYGPLWLAITVPLSFLGWQKLVPTMILIKGLGVVGYLLGCWAIGRILAKLMPKKRLFGLALFAFSPLVLIEGLVSAHNDILMMALVLLGFWFLLEKKYLPAWLFLFLSVGIKFVTAALIPVFALITWQQWRKKTIAWGKIMFLGMVLMIGAVLAAIGRDELKPWYLLYPLVFLPFLPKNWFFWPMTGLSLGALLHYTPFLYLGNWNPPVPAIKFWLTVGFLLLGFLLAAGTSFFKGRRVVVK